MSSMARMPMDAVVVALLAWAAAAGAWAWHGHVLQHDRGALPAEPWEQVREKHPMPAPFEIDADGSSALLEAVVKANPFSPERRRVRVVTADDAQPPPKPPEPKRQFAFKGRVTMGTAVRAIIEDVNAKKTHFLQVGQEVAGFKVLDIQETRVILSDSKSHEELSLSLSQAKPH